jgi:uncharacterized protein (TIGR00251 family)
VKLKVKVVPGSSKNSIDGWLGNELKIRISAAPEKGRANKAVIKLLEKALAIPKGSISLHSGATNPHKIFTIDETIDGDIIKSRLNNLD